MAANQGIDVYKQWLGITAENRPLNYYQLLKLNRFEDNTGLIRKQYRTLNAHIRKFASGEYLEESQNLLNELAKAMLCLTDADRKAEYDALLGREQESTKVRKSFDDILLANKICTPDQMKKAKSYADAVGIELYQAALQHKIGTPEVIMLAYAESVGLPFINLDDIGVDEEYAPQISPVMARQQSLIPVMVDQGKLILASPRMISPDIEEELRMLFDMPVRPALCVPSQLNEAIAKYYPKDAVQMIVQKSGKSAAAPAKTKEGKKTAPVKTNDEPLTQDDIDKFNKTRLQGTIVAFNCGVIAGVVPATQLLKFSMFLGI
ncbi:MAG: hypothetical protein LBQ54_10870, partial [Planctomycetaceae bacterium]|nr:hypothetical protein [Planctomycetaceae bacterium]